MRGYLALELLALSQLFSIIFVLDLVWYLTANKTPAGHSDAFLSRW